MVDLHHGIPHIGHAEDPQQGNRGQPFIRQHQTDHGLRQRAEAQHDRENAITSHTHVLQEHTVQLFRIVLQPALYGIYGPHDHVREIGGGELRPNERLVIVPQLDRRESLANHQRIKIGIQRMQQSGQQQLRPKREQYPERARREAPAGHPARQEPDKSDPQEIVQQGLVDQGPRPVAPIGQPHADTAAQDHGQQRCLGLPLEIESYRHPGLLHYAKGIDNEGKPHHPRDRDQLVLPIKSRYPRGGPIQQEVNADGDPDIKIEHRAVIHLRPVLLLDQGIGEAAVNEGLRYRHEDAQHRYQPIIRRQ